MHKQIEIRQIAHDTHTPTHTHRMSATHNTHTPIHTHPQDELLRQAVTEYGPKNWKRISDAAFEGLRTDVQCLHRWQKVTESN